jgi:hypothetical protein
LSDISKDILSLKVAGVSFEVFTAFEINKISGYQPLNWLKMTGISEIVSAPVSRD